MFLTTAVVLASSLAAAPPGQEPGAGRAFPRAQEPSAGSMVQDRAPSDRGVDGEFLFNYYDQDGTHSPVTGGLGTEALHVVSPVIVSRWRLNDRWSLNASFGLDQITSASTDNIDDDVSSASRVDQRAFTTLEVARTFENQTVAISGGFSNEYDYRSIMAGGRWARDFNVRNTTVAASARYYADQVMLIGINGSGDDDDVPSTRRQTADFSFSLTQVLGRRTVGTIEAGWTFQRGFLSTPFHEVLLADTPGLLGGVRVAERLPSSRDRRAIGVRVNHALTDWLVQRGGYRFYNDTFGINAHSIESETHVRVPAADEMWLFPIVRFHRQAGSDYFGLPGTQVADAMFRTADRDLSRFTSWRYGGGWKWVGAGGGTLGPLPFRSIEARFTVYDRDDGLRGFAASVGFGWGL